jgi:general secretion pathway protein K
VKSVRTQQARGNQAGQFGQVVQVRKTVANSAEDAKFSNGENGFALVFVVWCIGLLSLLFVTYVAAARYRSIEGLSLAAHAKAEALAQSAIQLAIFDLLAGLKSEKIASRRFPSSGITVHCSLDGRYPASIAVADEGGKVDLNTASPELVSALFRSVYDKDTAERLANRLLRLRTAAAPAKALAGPSPTSVGDASSPGPIRTVMELDQLVGSDSKVWRALTPLVTVHSQSPGIDPAVASVDVLTALARSDRSSEQVSGKRIVPTEFTAPSPARRFLIRAEVSIEPKARSALEAIVEFSLEMPKGYRIHEWRTGAPTQDHPDVPTISPAAC